MASAQVDSLFRQADRLLTYKAYGRAIDAYTQLLAEPPNKLTTDQEAMVQSQLAYAYRQVGDGVKAERFYRESLMKNPAENPQMTLNFAQTLAGNGKFQEAQQHYERYVQQKDKVALQRQSAGPIASAVPGRGPNGAGQYRLEYLALNTPGEEFSPAFFQDGLVYLSGSKGGSAIETSGRGGGSGYLDLFYAPNRNNLSVAGTINANGTTTRVDPPGGKTGRQVGADDYSRPTANDSQTVPNFTQSVTIGDGLGYRKQAGSAGQRFSDALNSRYHEGPVTFSRDGSRIIFTRNNSSEGRASQSAEGVTKLKLYSARLENGLWTDIAELPFNSDEYSVGHPSLSRDDQLLYFASDMPGGSGGTDLYVSRNQNGRWGKPTNLGPDINTKGSEFFPFVDDGGNLYFATDGRKGLGKLDVFYANLSTAATGLKVKSIEHLPAPINSTEDDFGLIADRDRRGGYLSSSRRNGNDDIYRFVREGAGLGCRNLTLRVYDIGSSAPIDSASILIKAIGEGRPDQTKMTDANGFISLCLDGDSDFLFQASRDGYINGMIGFTTRFLTDDQPSQLEMSLMKPIMIVDTVDTVPAKSETSPSSLETRSRVRGIVISERFRRPIKGVTVRLRNECNKNQVDYVTGADGRYSFDLDEGCDYTLIASKPMFGTNTNQIKSLPKRSKPNVLSADLRMIGVGDVVTIDNIYYDLDRSSLRSDATRELDKLVATMRKYPSLITEIRSHTDSRGGAEQNKQLSARRAKAVAEYLASKGIGRQRMTTVGMGESQLINNCTDEVICTEAEHQRNRRTEFRVIDIK